jgi:hypothetical protein
MADTQPVAAAAAHMDAHNSAGYAWMKIPRMIDLMMRTSLTNRQTRRQNVSGGGMRL